ncbi:MAG: GNAT family N-acetyltransferase [Brevinematia bacterium]
MLTLSYRKATLSDLSFILKVESECFNQIDLFKKYQVYHFLRNPNNSIISDIITLDDNSIGWACYFTRKNYSSIRLYSICISPSYHGNGYAKKYLIERLNELSSNFDRIYLEVRISNLVAIGLYSSLGFKKLKELPGYYLNEDGIKMVCRLPLAL